MTHHAEQEVVSELLEANPDAARMVDNNVDYLPLHCASQSRASLEVVLALLKAHPDGARKLNKGGGTALHLAAWSNSSREVVKALLEAHPGAASVADVAGWLPLHCAAAQTPPECKVSPASLRPSRAHQHS